MLQAHVYWDGYWPYTVKLGIKKSVQYVDGVLHTCWPDMHGWNVGVSVGTAVGIAVVGIMVGAAVGAIVGAAVGCSVGASW